MGSAVRCERTIRLTLWAGLLWCLRKCGRSRPAVIDCSSIGRHEPGRWDPVRVCTPPQPSKFEADIRTVVARNNEEPKPCRGTESADEVLSSVRYFCQKAE